MRRQCKQFSTASMYHIETSGPTDGFILKPRLEVQKKVGYICLKVVRKSDLNGCGKETEYFIDSFAR